MWRSFERSIILAICIEVQNILISRYSSHVALKARKKLPNFIRITSNIEAFGVIFNNNTNFLYLKNYQLKSNSENLHLIHCKANSNWTTWPEECFDSWESWPSWGRWPSLGWLLKAPPLERLNIGQKEDRCGIWWSIVHLELPLFSRDQFLFMGWPWWCQFWASGWRGQRQFQLDQRSQFAPSLWQPAWEGDHDRHTLLDSEGGRRQGHPRIRCFPSII